MDSSSDGAGSGGSVTSRESCLIQRQPQPVPSIRGAKDAASSRQPEPDTWHSLPELAGPHSHSGKSVQYEVWDSRPQLSELTEVNPDLRPSSWKTASHYGSLSDLFAPIWYLDESNASIKWPMTKFGQRDEDHDVQGLEVTLLDCV